MRALFQFIVFCSVALSSEARSFPPPKVAIGVSPNDPTSQAQSLSKLNAATRGGAKTRGGAASVAATRTMSASKMKAFK